MSGKPPQSNEAAELFLKKSVQSAFKLFLAHGKYYILLVIKFAISKISIKYMSWKDVEQSALTPMKRFPFSQIICLYSAFLCRQGTP